MRNLSKRASVIAAVVTLALSAPVQADDAAPKLLERIHAASDFIDDPFALSQDGSRIAWITTDGATRSEVHIGTVGSTKDAKAFPYSSITPERVEFVDAERVLVVERNPTTRFARAEVFGGKGSLGKYGPATDVGVGKVGGVMAIITWLKTTSAKGATHTFNAWRLDTLRPLAKKVLIENPDGRVAFAGSYYKPLYFLDGLATLVGQKEGAYDKKKDIRLPDRAARADLFAGKLIDDRELKDVVGYAEFTNMRKKYSNQTNFVRLSDDHSRLELVTGDLLAADAVSVLDLPNPVRKYDAETLLYRATPDGNLIVSLTVDPVNAEAVKAQKADKDWLDIYHVDVKGRTATQLLRIDAEKRPTTWWLTGNRLALLRKHKGFGRGGPDLDVLEVATVKPKAAPSVAKDGVDKPAPTPAANPGSGKGDAPATKDRGAKAAASSK